MEMTEGVAFSAFKKSCNEGGGAYSCVGVSRKSEIERLMRRVHAENLKLIE